MFNSLNGILHQVGKSLEEQGGIRFQGEVFRWNREPHLDPSVRGPESLHHIVENLVQGNLGFLGGRELGELQEIGDDAVQPVAFTTDQGYKRTLILIEPLFGQKIRCPFNGRHRGADFVGQIGGELPDGRKAVQGSLVPLGFPDACEILEHHDHSQLVAPGIPKEGGVETDLNAPVLIGGGTFHTFAFDRMAVQQLLELLIELRQFGPEYIGGDFPLVGVQAQDPLGAPVQEQHLAGLVHGQQGRGHVFHHGFQADLGAVQIPSGAGESGFGAMVHRGRVAGGYAHGKEEEGIQIELQGDIADEGGTIGDEGLDPAVGFRDGEESQ